MSGCLDTRVGNREGFDPWRGGACATPPGRRGHRPTPRLARLPTPDARSATSLSPPAQISLAPLLEHAHACFDTELYVLCRLFTLQGVDIATLELCIL